MVPLLSEIYPGLNIQNAQYYSYFLTIRNGTEISLAPADHALYFPIEFDCVSRNILRGEKNFFNQIIVDNYDENNVVPTDKLSWRSTGIRFQKAIIINVLDNCYGHAFFKMLALLPYYKRFGKTHDFIVIAPKKIAHHIPSVPGIHICEIDIGFQEAQRCYSLAPVIDFVRKNYSLYDFALPSTYPLFDTPNEVVSFFNWFGGDFPCSGEPKCDIVFYYRSDFFRTWGGRRQKKNILELMTGLRPFFKSPAKFHLLGDLDENKFPDWISDKRVYQHSASTDFCYNRIYANSMLVIGLTGSNMLCPSLFANMTIHLVPTQKTKNTAEDILRFMVDTVEAQYKNVYLHLDDLGFKQKGRRLLPRILALLQAKMEKDFKLKTPEFTSGTRPEGQRSYISSAYRHIDYAMLSEHNAKVVDRSFRRILARWRLHRTIKAFKGLAMNSSDGQTVSSAKT